MQNVLSNEFAHRLHIKENMYLDVWLIIFGSLLKGFDRNWIPMFFALLLGLTVIYFFGVIRLLAFVGNEKVFLFGVAPFLVGDLLKTGMVMILIPSG